MQWSELILKLGPGRSGILLLPLDFQTHSIALLQDLQVNFAHVLNCHVHKLLPQRHLRVPKHFHFEWPQWQEHCHSCHSLLGWIWAAGPQDFRWLHNTLGQIWKKLPHLRQRLGWIQLLLHHLFISGGLSYFIIRMCKSTICSIFALPCAAECLTILGPEIHRMICLLCSCEACVIWEVRNLEGISSLVHFAVEEGALEPIVVFLVSARSRLKRGDKFVHIDAWQTDAHPRVVQTLDSQFWIDGQAELVLGPQRILESRCIQTCMLPYLYTDWLVSPNRKWSNIGFGVPQFLETRNCCLSFPLLFLLHPPFCAGKMLWFDGSISYSIGSAANIPKSKPPPTPCEADARVSGCRRGLAGLAATVCQSSAIAGWKGKVSCCWYLWDPMELSADSMVNCDSRWLHAAGESEEVRILTMKRVSPL